MPSPPNRRLDFDRRFDKAILIARELTAQRLLKGSKLRRAQPAVKATPEPLLRASPATFLQRPLPAEGRGRKSQRSIE